MARQHHPRCYTGDVDYLVTTNQEDGKIGRIFALLEKLNPPPNRETGINHHVEQSQSYATGPPQNQAQQYAVNAAMHPGCRVRKSNFVDGHPFILEQPVRDQVKHEGRFEGGQGHVKLVMTVTYPPAASPTTERKLRQPRAVARDFKRAAQKQFTTGERFWMRFHAAIYAEPTSYWQAQALENRWQLGLACGTAVS